MIVNLLMIFAFSRDYYENFMLWLYHVKRIVSVKKYLVKKQERTIRIQPIRPLNLHPDFSRVLSDNFLG